MDAEAIRAQLAALCALPHRGSTTEEERQASGIIADRLRMKDVEVEVERFYSHTTWSWVYAILFGGFVAASFLSAVSPLLAFLLSLLLLYFNYAEHTTRYEGIGQFLPKQPSQNVVGRRRSPEPRAHVVVSCHYDTSRSGLSFSPALVKHFRASFISSLVVQGGLALVFFVRIFNGDGFLLDAFQVLATAYLLYGVVLMVDRELRGQYVNGANDNGTGVAVMLALADRFSSDPPEGLDLWFLANGCEEVGMTGQRHFLLNHAHELPVDRTFFLNVDNVGAGRLRYCTGEGMIKFYPYSPTLLHLARQVARTSPFQDVTPHAYRRAYFDALVPAARGYEALTLIALDEEDQIPNWHWPTDTLENVDVALVKKTADYSEAILRRLDRELRPVS
jgi:hypothetical protein